MDKDIVVALVLIVGFLLLTFGVIIVNTNFNTKKVYAPLSYIL